MGPMPLWSNHHCATRFLHFWSLSATNLKPPRAPLDCFGHQKQSLHKKKHRNWKTHCIKYTKTHVFVGVHYLAEKHFIALKSSWFTHSLVAADHPRKWTVALSCNDHSRFVWITGHATVWIWWFINMFKQCLNPLSKPKRHLIREKEIKNEAPCERLADFLQRHPQHWPW